MKAFIIRQKLAKHFFLRYLVAFSMSVLYFLFHLHFMQQFADYDSIVYVNNSYLALTPGYILYNPHHLHMEVGGMLFHRWMVKTFGSYGFTDLLFNLQIRSLLAACIGIFFAVLYFWEITGKPLWGILGASLIGFCHGYLHYATKVDTGIFPAASFISIAWIVNRIEKIKIGGVLLLSLAGGVFLFAGVMAHQYMVIACVIACFSIALPPYLFPQKSFMKPFSVTSIKERTEKPLIDAKPHLRYSAFFVLAFTGALLVIGAYFYAGKTEYNLSFDEPTPGQSRGLWRAVTFQQWLLAYSAEGKWGYGFKWFNPKAPFRGYTDAFVTRESLHKYFSSFTFPYDMEQPFSEKAFVYNQLAFFTILAFLGCLLFFPVLWKRYKRSFAFLFLCIVAYVLFFTYWEPAYFEFWILPSIMVCAVSILILNALGEKLAAILKKPAHLPSYAYIAFLVFIFSSHNMRYYLVPHSRIRVVEGMVTDYVKDAYQRLFTYPYYQHPQNVYQEVYHTEPGSYLTVASKPMNGE